MENRGNLPRDVACDALRRARDDARRRLEEYTTSMPRALEPDPLLDIPGGVLELESEHRQEMANRQRSVLDAQRALEEQCGETPTEHV